MNIAHFFTQTFCCVLPCPLGLVIFMILPFTLTLRRRKAINDMKKFYQELAASSHGQLIENELLAHRGDYVRRYVPAQ